MLLNHKVEVIGITVCTHEGRSVIICPILIRFVAALVNRDDFAERVIGVRTFKELRFYVKSANWFELGTPSNKTAFWGDRAETWKEVKLVKGEGVWTVYIDEKERGKIVLTNLKDDFFIRCGDSTVYISELLGVLDTNA